MADETGLPPHSIRINVVPTDEWLAVVTIETEDSFGDSTLVKLHSHEAVALGGLLVRFGMLIDGFNEKLGEKSVEARKEILELTALANGPSAEDPMEGFKLN